MTMLSKLESSMSNDDVKKQKGIAIAVYSDDKLSSLTVSVPCCEQIKSTMTF
jgi:hypothetical protein